MFVPLLLLLLLLLSLAPQSLTSGIHFAVRHRCTSRSTQPLSGSQLLLQRICAGK